MGADPIVSAIVAISDLENKPIPGFLIRKERKGHGRKKLIEGFKGNRGDKVVIVDEVCTTGKSIQEAIEEATKAGLEVVAVISLVDREEGGSEELKQKFKYYSIFRAKDLLNEQETDDGTSTQKAQETAGDTTSIKR